MDFIEQISASAQNQQGLNALKAMGVPTRQKEEWHYTSLKSLQEVSWKPIQSSLPTHDELLQIKTYLHPEFTNLVFFNGVFEKSLSSELPTGVKLSTNASSDQKLDGFTKALSHTLQATNYTLEVAKDILIEKPLHLILVGSAVESLASATNMKIKMGGRSKATIIESSYSISQSQLSAEDMEIEVGDSATLTYVAHQSLAETCYQFKNIKALTGNTSQLTLLTMSLGAKLCRNDLYLGLTQPGASVQVLGATVVAGNQYVDNYTVMDHLVGQCQTTQLYKGILGGSSKTAFTGKVCIQKDSQKAFSEQLNNNMLLSSKAEANSRPMLEIYADDVKAGHGSTVGQLNPEEMFYLLSRGIKREVALPMLSFAFISEVVEKVEHEGARQWLQAQLNKSFDKLKAEVE